MNSQESSYRWSNRDSGPDLVLEPAAKAGAVLAFSTRDGGVSPEPFDSANFSLKVGDSQDNVGRNLAALGDRVGLDPRRIAYCRQVHGNEVVKVDSFPHEPTRADAMISATPGVFLAIKTADCLPILIVDPVRRVVAAVHAGWKGTVLRITHKTVTELEQGFGCDPSDLIIGMGPAIGPCCFEVDEHTTALFRLNVPYAESNVYTLEDMLEGDDSAPADDGRQVWGRNRVFLGKSLRPAPLEPTRSAALSHRIDLFGTNRAELINLGVSPSNIHAADVCTACHADLFFSYRRDKASTGRHIAIVGFRE